MSFFKNEVKQEKVAAADKISFRSVMSQAISAGVLQTISDIYYNGVITYFYMQNLGLDAAYAAMTWIIFSIWDTIDNLIVGNIEDRSDSSLGRRLPYLRVCAPIAGIMFCLSFFKMPFVHSQFTLALSMFITLFILDLAVSFLETALFSIPYEESLSKKERGKVLVIQAIFSALSMIITVGLVPAILPDPGESLYTFRIVMCVIGIVAGVTMFCSSYFIDSSYHPDTEAISKEKKWKYIVDCLKNKAFIVSELFEVATMVAYGEFIFGIYYYFDEICTNQMICYIGAALGILTGFLSYFIMIDRFDLKKIVVINALSSGVVVLIGYFVGGTVYGGAIACFGCGVACVGELVYYWLLYGDVVDADEVKSGIRKEGTYNGLNNIFISISNLVQPLFIAIILAYGYVEHSKLGTQSLQAQHGIMVAWLIPTAVVLIVAGILIWIFYPLSEKRVEDNVKILKKRRTEKEESYHSQLKVSFTSILTEIPGFFCVVVTVVYTQSLITWMDFIDALRSLLEQILTLLMAKKLSRNLKFEYNYGVDKLEALSSICVDTLVIGGMVILAFFSISEIIVPQRPSDLILYLAIWYAISIGMDTYFYLSEKKINEENKSVLVENKKASEFSSLLFDAVAAIAMMITYIFRSYKISWIIAPAVTFCLCIYFLLGCIKRIKKSIDTLTEKTLPESQQLLILKALNSCYEDYGELIAINSHQSEEIIYIDLNIKFDAHTTYEEIERFREKISKEIKKDINNSKITISIE